MSTGTRPDTRGTAPANAAWEVTLPDGTVHRDMTEHQALMLTLHSGGGMKRQEATTK